MAQNGMTLNYDLTLLEQGKYKEWFWLSMSPEALSWLKRDQCPKCKRTLAHPAARCRCVEAVKQEGLPRWVNRQGLLWRLQAACQGADITIFFPTNQALYNRPDAAWRRYCLDCPVSDDCTLSAYDSRSEGVWGGRPFGIPKSADPYGTGKRGRRPKNAGP